MIKPYSCKGCAFETHENAKGYSQTVVGRNNIALVGYAPSYKSTSDGVPFSSNSASGIRLRLAMNQINPIPTLNHFGQSNLVQCVSPTWNVMDREMAIDRCKRNRDPVLEKADVILTFGDVAAKHIIGENRLGSNKKKATLDYIRGMPFEVEIANGKKWVIPTYDPEMVQSGFTRLTPMLVRDIEKAIRLASGEWRPQDYKPNYIVTPTVNEARLYLKMLVSRLDSLSGLSVDIETLMDEDVDEDEKSADHKEITQIQFSHKKGFGIVFPWDGEYKEIAKQILSLKVKKIGFNWWNFDGKVLRENDILVRGATLDLMVKWKHLFSGLPKNLQTVASFCDFPFPWKHLFNDDIGKYGCADVDSLWWIEEFLNERMREIRYTGSYENGWIS